MTGAKVRGTRARSRTAATVVTAVLALIIGVCAPQAATASAAAAPDVAASSGQPQPAAIVKAADLSEFTPGSIIEDAVFFNSGTMTEAQIQTFLQSKVSSCKSGYTCLKDYYDTSRTIGADEMCGAYSGGVRERASRIIYKVARACGINPQVIIVMLQKEQGLISSTAPSSYNYRAAMGQGCPDTAACDTRYYGFFNQVYGGAWQMKRYANPPGTSQFFTWYAPGKTWDVLYHPNRSCGTSKVYIANQATANLYYYTPYQPNAAALRAGYGTGDGCSSYGNRNFFNYFTDWFGSTKYYVTGAMRDEWQRRGGATGQLGNPISASTYDSANGGGYVQYFERGAVWRPNAGGGRSAYSMGEGPFYTNYLAARAQSGGWGWPQANPVCGLAGGGCSMASTSGSVYYSAATQSHLVLPELDAFYRNAGGPSSRYGYPSSGLLRGPDSSYEQGFQSGHFIHQEKNGVVSLSPAVASVWKAWGGLYGRFQYATGATAVNANGGGTVYEFVGGSFFESPAGVYHLGTGPLRNSYLASGGPSGTFGWPTGAAQCGLTDGGCVMDVQRGVLAFSTATGSVLVSSATATAWMSNRGPAWLGYPTGAPTDLAGGQVQRFQKGSFYVSSAGAIGMTSGGLGAAYAAVGGPTGPAGWPTAAAQCGQINGGCLMPTQNGTIAYSSRTAAVLVPTAAATAWLTNRGPAWLGYPTSASRSVSGGLVQSMERGVLYTFGGVGVGLANGPLGAGYIALGAQAGAAGWPTAAAVCGQVGGGCTMLVQHGMIAYSPSTGVRLVPAVLTTAWQDRGGPGGALGYPVAAATTSGTVTSQRFQGATLRYDSATGAVTVG